MNSIILLNVIGGLFILCLTLHFIFTAHVRKRCKPIHKRPFRIQRFDKSRKHGIAVVISGFVLWALWLYGIFYYEIAQLPLLYLAALVSLTAYFPLFRQGKVRQQGIAIAGTFITWQEVEHSELISPKISDVHYPDPTLLVSTKNGSSYSFIIDQRDAGAIAQFLTKNKLK